MTVVTFEDFVPIPRLDGVPWTQVRIEEAPARIGPWTVIDTQVLNPVDTDPANPQARDFTTALATLTSGWYRITFLDAGNNFSNPSDPILNSQIAFRPSLSEVGALVRDRTNDIGGNELGTFNNNTRPTADEANQLVDQAVADGVVAFGDNIPDGPGDPSDAGYDPDGLRTAARKAVAYHAAALIELSHFGEQVARGNSPYAQYEALWEEMKASIQAAIEAAGGDVPSSDQGSLRARGDFPADGGGMVGWGTVW